MGAEPKIGVTTLKEAVPPTPPEKIDMSGSSSFSSGFLPRARIPQGKVAIPSISSPRRTKTESCSCLLQEMPVYSEITSAVTAHEPTTLATHATPPLTTRIPIRLELVSRWSTQTPRRMREARHTAVAIPTLTMRSQWPRYLFWPTLAHPTHAHTALPYALNKDIPLPV